MGSQVFGRNYLPINSNLWESPAAIPQGTVPTRPPGDRSHTSPGGTFPHFPGGYPPTVPGRSRREGSRFRWCFPAVPTRPARDCSQRFPGERSQTFWVSSIPNFSFFWEGTPPKKSGKLYLPFSILFPLQAWLGDFEAWVSIRGMTAKTSIEWQIRNMFEAKWMNKGGNWDLAGLKLDLASRYPEVMQSETETAIVAMKD